MWHGWPLLKWHRWPLAQVASGTGGRDEVARVASDLWRVARVARVAQMAQMANDLALIAYVLANDLAQMASDLYVMASVADGVASV